MHLTEALKHRTFVRIAGTHEWVFVPKSLIRRLAKSHKLRFRYVGQHRCVHVTIEGKNDD